MSVLQVDTIRDRGGAGSPTLDKGVVVSGASTLGYVRVLEGAHGAWWYYHCYFWYCYLLR